MAANTILSLIFYLALRLKYVSNTVVLSKLLYRNSHSSVLLGKNSSLNYSRFSLKININVIFATTMDLLLGRLYPYVSSPYCLYVRIFPTCNVPTLQQILFALTFASHSKKIRKLSVQPGLRGSNEPRVGRKMATFQLFFQSREQMIVRRGQIRE